MNTEGDLLIEGQDLGSGVERFFGDGLREYEWVWTIRSRNIPRLRRLLGASRSDDVLDLLAERFAGEAAGELKRAIDSHGIPAEFWSRVGD